MTAKRKRPPTDELLTDIYESKDLKPMRGKKPTAKGHDTADTRIDPPRPPPLPPTLPVEPPQQPTPPIRVISMKTPAEVEAEARLQKDHKVAIRSLSEIRRQHDTPPGGFGNLAPPRDPKEVRARRLHDHLIWGSLVVIVACAVMLGVWFLARS